MALDPTVLEARIDLRICELKVLAAQTAVNWARACEREKSQSPHGLPPLPRDDEPDEARGGDPDRTHRATKPEPERASVK